MELNSWEAWHDTTRRDATSSCGRSRAKSLRAASWCSNNISAQTYWSNAVKIVKVLRSHQNLPIHSCALLRDMRAQLRTSAPLIDSIFLAGTRNRSSTWGVPLFYVSHQWSPCIPAILPASYHQNFLCCLFLLALAHPVGIWLSPSPVVPSLFLFKRRKLFRGEQTGLNR